MPIYKTKFHVDSFFFNIDDNREHPLKEVIKPLTPAEMLRRSLNGQPISCHNYSQEDRLIFQKRFFGLGDKMDTIDAVLKAHNDYNKRRDDALKKIKEQQQQQLQQHQETSEE